MTTASPSRPPRVRVATTPTPSHRPTRVTLLATLVALACDPAPPGAVARFTPAGEGAVRDAATGLTWTDRDAGRDLAWGAAEAYCRELARAGHDDWRLPEIDELLDLYGEAAAQPCGAYTCGVDPAVELSRPFYWSATARPRDRRFYADLRFGTKLAPILRPVLTRRVLCVREDGRTPEAPPP